MLLPTDKNAQFNKTAPAGGFVGLQNAISGMFVTEDPERETLKLTKSPSGGAALWSVEGKLLKNKASGRCIGRWQNAPPPAPGPHPGPHGHGATTATEENIEYLVKWMLGLKKYKNLTIDSIGVGYNEVRRTIAGIRMCSDDSNKAGADRVASPSRG